jgi:hypothetical protein
MQDHGLLSSTSCQKSPFDTCTCLQVQVYALTRTQDDFPSLGSNLG